VGSTVTWVDFDVHDYTIISDDGLFAGEIVPSEFGFGFPGKQTFSYRFESPGAFTWTAQPDYFVSNGVIIVLA
jgi:plastocyanin